MTQLELDVAVVGAGVVGLAAAAALARRGRTVVVFERHDGIAREASSRNSGVVHAGLYYPPDSVKARSCREGRERLHARCREWRVPYRRIGKLVVAADATEAGALEGLAALGRANGAPDLEILDGAGVTALEPAVRAHAGLLSPDTGIVDADAYAMSFQAEAERYGAVVSLRTEVVTAEQHGAGYRLSLRRGDAREEVRAAAVVNAAGLAADDLASRVGLDVDQLGCRIHPCKGDYFALAPGAPIQIERLVYPVPSGPGLGVHATPDLAGRIRFGPDANYVGKADLVGPAGLVVREGAVGPCARAARRFLPSLQAEWLTPDFAGVRARLAAPGEAFRDFVIAERSEEGRPAWVDLLGIESPGLTAAAALGEEAAELLAGL